MIPSPNPTNSPKNTEAMKGDYKDECNRKACNISPATYYNHSTEKHYCRACALEINEANFEDAIRIYGHDLCTPVEMEDRVRSIILSQWGNLLGVGKASEVITALMCYREVRAIMEWVGVTEFNIPEVEDGLVIQLKEHYNMKLVWQAIEQVKKEMK